MRAGPDRGDPPERWQILDEDAETQWLEGRVDDRPPTGLDATGWEASTWVLHSMYEDDSNDATTFDEWHRARIDAGLEEPLIIGGVNVDEELTSTGIPLGFVEQPDETRWRRLEWRVLAERLGVEFSHQDVPPCFRWFPHRSWPVAVLPPPEGSLDGQSLDALAAQLAAFGPSDCVALYSFLAAGASDDASRCFVGSVTDLRALIQPEAGRIGTPSNVWALDRSWFVLTDWDLLATKVSGPSELIEMIESAGRLETIRWP